MFPDVCQYHLLGFKSLVKMRFESFGGCNYEHHALLSFGTMLVKFELLCRSLFIVNLDHFLWEEIVYVKAHVPDKLNLFCE